MKNVLLLKGVTPYGAGANYIDEWASALRKMGCNTCVLDGNSLSMPMWYDYVIAAYKFDVVLDCNGNLIPHGIPGNLPPQTIYGTYLHDHPVELKRLRGVDERTVVFSCDSRFCDYMDQYFPMIKHKEFIPLSGSFYPEYLPYEERSKDIIFTGSYREPEPYKEQVMTNFKMSGGNVVFAKNVLEDIIGNPQYTLEECVFRVLEKDNIDISNDDFCELMENIFFINYYVRLYYRDRVVRTLLEAGLQLHVFGNGWEDFHSKHREKLIIHKGGAYAARKALAESKIALNMLPWFKGGFQERIASAMLSKVVAVTDESTYIRDEFEDDKELLVFSLKDIESLPERIKYLLSHPEKAAEMAENGYQKAQKHTWFARVQDMMQKVEEDFGMSLSSEEEGKELELEFEFPDQKTELAEAVYQLQKMADLAENDVGKIDKLSKTDMDFLLQKFERFAHQFSGRFDGITISNLIQNGISNSEGEVSKELPKLFSMQCRALIGKLLLKEQGLKL